MVQRLPASEYIRFAKSAKMLEANQRMSDIESSSFHAFEQKHRDNVMRNLKRASKQFLFEPLKDFSEVAANFAQRLKDGR